MKYWIEQLKVNIGVDEKLCIAIAGNKVDSPEKDRKVPTQMGEEIANINGALFNETSARTGENVNTLFIKASKKLFFLFIYFFYLIFLIFFI